MLRRISPETAHCFEKAAECDRLAAEVPLSETREFYGRLGAAWRLLAENRQFVDRLSDFLIVNRGPPH